MSAAVAGVRLPPAVSVQVRGLHGRPQKPWCETDSAGPAAASRVNPAGLTERQSHVVNLPSRGMTNAEIAAQLVLSVRTVDSHVAAALDKLGTATRKEAAAWAGDLGLLGPG